MVGEKQGKPMKFFGLERNSVRHGGVLFQSFPNKSSILGCYFRRVAFFPPEDSIISFYPNFPTSGFKDPVPGLMKERFLGEQERGEVHPA